MRRFKSLVLILILILCFSISVHAEKINLITDKYWLEIIERESSQNPLLLLRKSVLDMIPFLNNSNIFAGKKKIKTYVVDVQGNQDDYSQISEAAASIPKGVIILSPLLSGEACRLAGDYPEKKIIVFSRPTDESCGELNFNKIYMDYESSYHDAGSWAASQDVNVYPLFFTGTEGSASLFEAFLGGWKEMTDKDAPEILELQKPGDTHIIDSFVDLIDNDPGCIAAVFAGPLTGTALDRLDGNSAGILGEHLLLWPDARYSVSASIELSPLKMLTEAVTYVSAESYGKDSSIKAEFILPLN